MGSGFAYFSLVGFSDHAGPREISGYFPFSLSLFGFALEGQGLLELLGDVKGVEAPRGSGHWL